jgi:poly(3-hydroxybutyrate) depolymerase
MALLAAVNIMRRYPVDPERVYIGGFSGGSRVALRIVLGYPDVFHGALLEAGSDPIGNADIPLPPVDLLRRLQDATRLVYVTGGRDAVRLDQDVASRKSLQGWCVFDTATQTMPWMGHELADAPAFSRALDALDQHAAPARMTIRRLTARRAPVATILQYV